MVLPAYLFHHVRDELLVVPENIVDRVALSPDCFIAFLHQNYVEFYPDINDIVSTADYLSDCDELSSDWSTRPALGTYSSSLAARAVAFCDRSRATEADQKQRSGLGWRPLHRPQSLDIIKKCEAAAVNVRSLFGIEGATCGGGGELFLREIIPYWGALIQVNQPRGGGGIGVGSRMFSTPATPHAPPLVLNAQQKSFVVNMTKFSSRIDLSRQRLETLDEFGVEGGVGELVDGDVAECGGDEQTATDQQTVNLTDKQFADNTFGEVNTSKLPGDILDWVFPTEEDEDDLRIDSFDD